MDGLSSEQIEKLRSVDSPTIFNIIDLFDIRSSLAGYTNHKVESVYPDLPPMVGYAVTASFRGAYNPRVDNPQGNVHRLIIGSKQVPAPHVVVIQELDEPPVAAIYGELFVTALKALGFAGLVTNGLGRDYQQVKEKSLPCFTAGHVVGRGFSKCVDVNGGVTVGGLSIQPGDLLHADANGVVQIPREIAADVVEMIDPFLAAEQIYLDRAARPGAISLEELDEAFGRMKEQSSALTQRARAILTEKRGTSS